MNSSEIIPIDPNYGLNSFTLVSCCGCWEYSWVLMNWLYSSISQWITPFTFHQTQAMSFFWCRSGFASLSFQLFLHIQIQTRFFICGNDIVHLIKKKSASWTKSVSLHGTQIFNLLTLPFSSKWCKMALWLMRNSSSAVWYGYLWHGRTNAHCQCVRVDHFLEIELAMLEFLEPIIGRATTNCAFFKCLVDKTLWLASI